MTSRTQSIQSSDASRRLIALVADTVAGSAEQTRAVLSECGAGSVMLKGVAEAELSVKAHRPDLVVIDADFGGTSQGLLLVEIVHRLSNASIVVVTSDLDEATRATLSERCHLLHRPVHGRQLRATIRLALARSVVRSDEFIGSDGRRRELEAALHQISVVVRALSGPSVRRRGPATFADLRPREREVAGLLLQHSRVPAIAQQLGISANTVRNHLKNIYRRFNVHSQQELLTALTRPPE